MQKLIFHSILALVIASPLAFATELNGLRPRRIHSSVNDTFACVRYRDALSLSTDPVLYVVGTSGSDGQMAESFGRNFDVDTPEGEKRFYQNVGDAGVQTGDEILFTFTESISPLYWHYDGTGRFVIFVGSVFPETATVPLIRLRSQDASAVQASNDRIAERLAKLAIEATDIVVSSWFIEETRIAFFGVEGKGWFSLSLKDLEVKIESVEHAIAQGLSHRGTRLSTLVFLTHHRGLMPVQTVREISVDRNISAIQRAFAGLALADAGDPSAEAVLNDLSFSKDEEVREIAEEGLFTISTKGSSGE